MARKRILEEKLKFNSIYNIRVCCFLTFIYTRIFIFSSKVLLNVPDFIFLLEEIRYLQARVCCDLVLKIFMVHFFAKKMPSNIYVSYFIYLIN